MAFCRWQKLSWQANGISPRAKIGLARKWHFAISRNWLSERVAFCHERKMSWRVNGVSPQTEIDLAKPWQHQQVIFPRFNLAEISEFATKANFQRTKTCGSPGKLPATPCFPFRSHLFPYKKNPAEKRNLSRIFFILRRKRCSICRFRLLSRR